MSAPRFLATNSLAGLVEDLVGGGITVFAPVSDGRQSASEPSAAPQFRRVRGLDGVVLDAAQLPALPLKALFLPPTEALFTWKQRHHDVELTEVDCQAAPAVVLGARPCDAAAVEALDKVMAWDYRDELWFGRRDSTTIVTVACSTPGDDCFCDRIGLGPDSTRGADVLLRPREGGFDAETVTEKGEALLARFPARFSPAGEQMPDAAAARGHGETSAAAGANADAGSNQPFDLAAIRGWLDAHFDDGLWQTLGLRCHGCGACASVCPTCHCFDIVDEPEGLGGGTRRRNWDTCQAGRFTVHASGHNPRGDQGARFRQRVMHKFAIYPQRFDTLLCTGCGRCARACPAGQHLPEILETIGRAAGSGKTTS